MPLIQNTNAALSFLAFLLAGGAQLLLIWQYRKDSVPVLAKALLGASILLNLYFVAAYGYLAFVEDAPGFGATWIRPALLGVAFLLVVNSTYMLSFFRLRNERKDFISRASHELRTPLSKFYTALELIVGQWGADAMNDQLRRDLLGQALRAAQALKILVENFAIVAGNGRHYESFNFTAVVRDACRRYEQLAAEKNVTIVCKLPDTELVVFGDFDGLSTAVAALLDNAVKFDAYLVNVELELTKSGCELKLTIDDNGIGIAERHQGRVWEWGYQVDGSHTRKHGGIGFGLPLAEAMIKKHGGKITMSSGLSRGSTFTVYLPIEGCE